MTSRSALPWLVLGTLAVSAALAWFTLTRGGPTGERGTQLERHPLPPFRELTIGGIAEVTLVQGDAESIALESGSRATGVEADVDDGRLTVRSRDRRRWWGRFFGDSTPRPAAITIHFRNLDLLTLTGKASVDVPRLETTSLTIRASGGASLSIDELRATTLRVDGSGALRADIAGRVTDEYVSISGAGSYRADGLHATNATVTVSGVANVVVHAARTLNASISGAGVVEYLGDPHVTENVTGIGRVKRRDATAAPRIRIAAAE